MTTRRNILKALTAAALPGTWPGWAQATTPASDRDVTFLEPGAAGFDAARRIYNSRIDRRPALIAVCATEAGVQRAVQEATGRNLAVAIRSGGHSLAGYSLNDGGMVIDVGGMKALRLMDGGRLVAEPGARLADLYAFLLPRGRLLPAGSCGGVGLGGLALGGGYGFFSREHGLTCDHLQSLRMVNAAAAVQSAGADSPLMRACRGGGNGNFGVVTQMTFSTVATPKTFTVARFRFRVADAAAAVQHAEAWFTLSTALPPSCYAALIANGRTLTVLVTSSVPLASQPGLKRLLDEFGRRATKVEPVSEEPLARALKRFYGQPGPLPFRNASAGFYRSWAEFSRFGAEVLRQVIEQPGLILQVNTFGPLPHGAPGAFPHRDAMWIGEIQAYWESANRAPALMTAVEKVLTRVREAGIVAHYANYGDPAIAQPLEAYYGTGLAELRALKTSLDPGNRFRHDQSVRP